MKPIIRAIKHNTHPGEIIFSHIIYSNNLSIDKTAKLLGVTRHILFSIVNGKKAISPLMAIRISKVFGGNAKLWIRLQAAYDLRIAEKKFEKSNIQLNRFQ